MRWEISNQKLTKAKACNKKINQFRSVMCVQNEREREVKNSELILFILDFISEVHHVCTQTVENYLIIIVKNYL